MSSWGAPTPACIIEFSNFLLQHKNQKSESKTVSDFCIIFILKGIMTFESQTDHGFCWKEIYIYIKINKNETGLKMENLTFVLFYLFIIIIIIIIIIKICFLSQYTFRIYILFIPKASLYIFCCLFLKLSKAFSVFLVFVT